MERFISKYFSEFIGTLLLVLIGCGSAVLAGNQIGYIGVAFAFGLTLMVLAYILGPVSGCHLNPAVTMCMVFTGRLPFNLSIGYVVSQFLGAMAAAFILYTLANGKEGFDIHMGFALNGYGAHSPAGYNLSSCLMAETIGTAILLYTILSTTHANFFKGFEGLTVGAVLMVLHLFTIPLTNTSLNLARSFGTAIMHGDWALHELWMFLTAHVLAIFLAIICHQLTHRSS